jgi:hypothetical protein
MYRPENRNGIGDFSKNAEPKLQIWDLPVYTKEKRENCSHKIKNPIGSFLRKQHTLVIFTSLNLTFQYFSTLQNRQETRSCVRG